MLFAVGWSPDPDGLRGRVAVVAGATRGAGRGIAATVGEAGATVVCTGRSTRATGSVRSDYDRAETIEDTADLVTRLGGVDRPLPPLVDHAGRQTPMPHARRHPFISSALGSNRPTTRWRTTRLGSHAGKTSRCTTAQL